MPYAHLDHRRGDPHVVALGEQAGDMAGLFSGEESFCYQKDDVTIYSLREDCNTFGSQWHSEFGWYSIIVTQFVRGNEQGNMSLFLGTTNDEERSSFVPSCLGLSSLVVRRRSFRRIRMFSSEARHLLPSWDFRR